MSAVTPTSPGFPLAMGTTAMPSLLAAPSSSSGSPIGASQPTTPLSAAFSASPAAFTYDDIQRWDDHEISAWLSNARLGHHAHTFAANDIRGAVLLEVDQAALKEMGITSVGDRVRIYAAIKALNKHCAESLARRRPSLSANSPLSYQNTLNTNDGEIEYLDTEPALLGSHDAMAGASGLNSMGLRRGQMRPPPLTLQQSSSRGMPGAGVVNGGQGFGLSAARGLTPGAARGNIRHPPSSSSSKSMVDGSLHRKVNSLGSAIASPASLALPSLQSYSGNSTRVNQLQPAQNGRPSTASTASSYSNMNARAGSSHPSDSPTSATFGTVTGTVRPATATGVSKPVRDARDAYSPLTPISEFNSYGTTPNTPSTNLNASSGYSVERRPSLRTAPQASSQQRQTTSQAIRRVDSGEGYNTAHYNYQNPMPPTLEDLKRRTIKFISEEDNTTRIVNVSDCRDAYDVMARVLKKFAKSPSGNSYRPTAGQGLTGDDLGADETWGIFATSADGQNTKALSDNELLAICHAPQPHDPLRERGLTLRRIPNHLPGEDARSAAVRSGRHRLEAFFGERMPVVHVQPGDDDDAGSITISGKKMKRASTVSIMSGLGVGPFSQKADSRQVSNSGRKDPKSDNSVSPSTKPSKIRNFFGQRPPSELINTNLADFFPTAEPKALQRTARRSVYGRSAASTRSKRNSTWSFVADPDAPPLPGKESMDVSRHDDNQLHPSSSSIRSKTRGRVTPPVIHIGYDSRSEDEEVPSKASSNTRVGPPTLPPVNRESLEDWSRELKAVGSPVLPDSGSDRRSGTFAPDGSSRTHSYGSGHSGRPPVSRRTSGDSTRSRRSLASQVRRSLASARERDAGDTASLLTVDEITQEVEHRRESMSPSGASGSWVVDEDGVPIPIPGLSSNRSSSFGPSSGIASSLAEVDENEVVPNTAKPKRVSSTFSDEPRPAPPQRMRSEDDEFVSNSDGSLSDSGSASESDMDSDGSDTDADKYNSTIANPPIKWHKGALIGAGSFGNVFLGMNAKTGLLMAVKQVELPSGDSNLDQRKKGMLEALESEIKLLKTLEHENIVQYLDSFPDRTHLNIFLEYVPGGSIVALLRNYGAFEEPLVRNFVRQILKGLAFLHNRGIMHRDIKGANILVDNKGGIKISDFGISKKVESDLALASNKAGGAGASSGGGGAGPRPSLQGSVFWMAPEVVKQTSYTIKADIWSLGCLVVEMISGTHPWAELNQMQALFQIGMGRKPSLPEEISNECKDFLGKTFELDYNNRPDADALLDHPFMGSEMTFDVPPILPTEGEDREDGDRSGRVERDTTVLDDQEDSALLGKDLSAKKPHRSRSTRRDKRSATSKDEAAAAKTSPAASGGDLPPSPAAIKAETTDAPSGALKIHITPDV